jgi:hypothetical protein
MASLGAPLAALLLLLAAPGPVRSEEPTRAAGAPPLEARLTLERQDGRATRTFAAGEELVLVLTLRNPSAAPQRLPLPSAQSYDFAVSTHDGRDVWRWSAGRRFAQMLTELALAPGEEKVFRERWSQQSQGGARVPPGRYRAAASVGTGGAALRVGTVEFSIDRIGG